ncbi:hypothetical protein [Methylosinus sp. LW4]|uniref:hypothetical protein n=1 Tax=Methylosinus sp. LW4 TaxID=136993 RepID=UPI0003822DF0|nr:hypothetical protein [Methylosinus sp. LW4]
MAELTNDDVREAVHEALAEKFEMTLGIDCQAPEERAEMRKDMEFLCSLRLGACKGGEKIFRWAFALLGTTGY